MWIRRTETNGENKKQKLNPFVEETTRTIQPQELEPQQANLQTADWIYHKTHNTDDGHYKKNVTLRHFNCDILKITVAMYFFCEVCNSLCDSLKNRRSVFV
jgi:hypothetical protein